MKPVERALVAIAYERHPHPSWGPAETYLLSPAEWSPGRGQTAPLVFARREPGSGGIVDWHYHPGDGSRVLLRTPEQLLKLLEVASPSLPIAASGQECSAFNPSSENPGVGGSIPPLATSEAS